jgi:pimeloyl-ACP methyl ester carboxylesterase
MYSRQHSRFTAVVTTSVALLVLATTASGQGAESTVDLEPCGLEGAPKEMFCGKHTVYEDRVARSGRTIDLNIVVVPAKSKNPRPDPVFYLAGGPGQGATTVAGRWLNAWQREERDIVFVDQRGTGRSNPLNCEMPGGDADAQGYLDPVFTVEVFEPCRKKLEQIADLRLYTTPIAMDDLNEVREALGYGTINVMGGSYGTRASLVYMRRHPETVRTAILNGVAPIAFRNPLYHAYEAQQVLDKTLDECEKDEACHAAFPNIKGEFEEVMARLQHGPATITVTDATTGGKTTIGLTRYTFAEALRTTMYYMPRARSVPLLIHRAYEGDFEFFATLGLATGKAIVDMLQFGMLLSVTCPEDLARIDPDEIPALTDDTFLGDHRVRNQMEACSIWPQGEVPADYGEPVSVDVPTLVLSGSLDPVTSVRWGEEAASHLPNSLHLAVPGAHGVGGPCINAIARDFLETASVKELDTACVANMKLPPFRLTADEEG